MCACTLWFGGGVAHPPLKPQYELAWMGPSVFFGKVDLGVTQSRSKPKCDPTSSSHFCPLPPFLPPQKNETKTKQCSKTLNELSTPRNPESKTLQKAKCDLASSSHFYPARIPRAEKSWRKLKKLTKPKCDPGPPSHFQPNAVFSISNNFQ